MVIRNNRISALLSSAYSNNLSKRHSYDNSNSGCAPFHSDYCKRHHKHQILQVSNTFAYNTKINKTKVNVNIRKRKTRSNNNKEISTNNVIQDSLGSLSVDSDSFSNRKGNKNQNHIVAPIKNPVITTTHINDTRKRNTSLSSYEVLSMGKIQDLKDKVGANQLKMPQKDIWRCLGAEFLGTALLVIIGCGCGLYTAPENKLPLVGVAICWGLIVASLAQSLGNVSGCHINPAVTVAMLVTGKIQLVKAGLYIFTQCLGAIIGTCVLKALTPETILGNFAPTILNEQISPLQGFGIELLLTFVLVTIIFGVNDENRTDVKGSGPLAIGLTVTGLILFGGPLTGASLNPARSLGPSIVATNWDNHWVFWLGPICGGIIASLLYQHVFRALRPDEVEAFEMENRSRAVEVKENSASPPV